MFWKFIILEAIVFILLSSYNYYCTCTVTSIIKSCHDALVILLTHFTAVTVRFANTTGTVSEGDGTVTITIVKEGQSDIPVTVRVTTSDITARGN